MPRWAFGGAWGLRNAVQRRDAENAEISAEKTLKRSGFGVAGSRTHRAGQPAEGRRRVRRWGGIAGVVRGCFRRATGSPASSGSFGLGGKWFRLVRVGPPKWVRSVTCCGGL